MLNSIFLNYLFGLLINKNDGTKKKKYTLALAIVTNIIILGTFKYASFFVINMNRFGLSLPDPQLPLPIGISFFTFQAMSYVFDVYRGDAKYQKNILNLALYISFFPQLIAGPIVRYQTIENQITARQESLALFDQGVKRFIVGLFKKIVIANAMGDACEIILANDIHTLGFVDSWIGMIFFAFQIFFDFSAYSDMAIGLARMFGFKFLENFNYPYIAKSITDFWRRWHISLSTWFRDYVYIPLGGNRVSTIKNIRNITIVWMLTGLWHGASWNFVLWGTYYGLLLLIEKYILSKVLDKAPAFLRHAYTMIIVLVGWTIFKLEDMSTLGLYLKKMFLIDYQVFASQGIWPILKNNMVIMVLAILLSTPIVAKVKTKVNPNIMSVVYILMLLVSVAVLSNASYNPFLYFRF
ncbi:MAG: MBOAT family O-acyltransferase [Eubacteriales bacterium]